jgi:hypothetical protein
MRRIFIALLETGGQTLDGIMIAAGPDGGQSMWGRRGGDVTTTIT